MYQQHLTYKEMTNYGCFYTPDKFVNDLIEKILKNVVSINDYVFIDTSCGYGAFLTKLSDYQTIGCDIDKKAIDVAKVNSPKTKYFVLNALHNFSRESINLTDEDKIIIIGNPPYNDTTSKVKQELKTSEPCLVDDDLKTRDMGISFLLSYNKLKADYVAVLHPLSYMIKKTNYDLLRPFFNNYTLIDHSIVSSQDFYQTSKTSGFPIIIALYKRDKIGLKYSDIMNMEFKTINNEYFNLKKDYIRNYISKYPSKQRQYKPDDILFFTMRDINALKRSRTFIDEYCDNAIIIEKSKFEYYCYVDVFKDYAIKLPYYYGNLDVFIDNEQFLKIKNTFITKSFEKHPNLKKFFDLSNFIFDEDYKKIDRYFDNLFGKTKVKG